MEVAVLNEFKAKKDSERSVDAQMFTQRCDFNQRISTERIQSWENFGMKSDTISLTLFFEKQTMPTKEFFLKVTVACWQRDPF